MQSAIIKQQLQNWLDAVTAGQVPGVLALYAQDGVLVPTLSSHIRRTPAELEDYFEHFLAQSPEAHLLDWEGRQLGAIAVASGHYRFNMRQQNPPQAVDARFTFVWRQQSADQWLILEHHSSLNPDS